MAKKILVVDDEADIRTSLKTILEKEGYEIDLAEEGKVCLTCLVKKKYDLIILDVMMPGMSGWDVLTEIMKTKKEYKNKIIFLSVVEVSENRKKELFKQGVVDYITKPFDIKTLISKINKILKK